MNAGQQWVAFTTILVKEVRRFMRIWQQTLLPPAITIALYFVIFGKLIGPRIGEMSGFTYPLDLVEITPPIQEVSHRPFILQLVEFLQIEIDNQCHLGIWCGFGHDGIVRESKV